MAHRNNKGFEIKAFETFQKRIGSFLTEGRALESPAKSVIEEMGPKINFWKGQLESN